MNALHWAVAGFAILAFVCFYFMPISDGNGPESFLTSLAIKIVGGPFCLLLLWYCLYMVGLRFHFV